MAHPMHSSGWLDGGHALGEVHTTSGSSCPAQEQRFHLDVLPAGTSLPWGEFFSNQSRLVGGSKGGGEKKPLTSSAKRMFVFSMNRCLRNGVRREEWWKE